MSDTVVTQAEWPDARLAVVDDEEPIRRVLSDMLRQQGYTDVQTFADGLAMMHAYDELMPDLVLLDLHMPQLDGVAVLKQLASRPESSRAPVIVMTGAGQREHARQSLSLGAADFLAKPVDPVELLLRVRHQLRERRLRRELANHSEHLEALVAERAGELALLSKVLDDMPLAAMVVRHDLKLHYANERGQRLLEGAGGDAADALTTAEDERLRLVTALAELGAEPATLRSSVRSASGAQWRVELSLQRVGDGFVTVLVHDIEEQQLTRETLQRALVHEVETARRMRNLEELRTRFLTAVSHELRTPLTIILGAAESLQHRDDQLGAVQRRKLVAQLYRNANRLHRLLDDLLDLNRLSAGRLTVHPEPHDLAALVHAALDEVEADDREIHTDLEACAVLVEGRQIRRAVANLVRNAVVHTPPGTPIRVSTRRDGDRVRIVVADRGDGVDDELKERIFDPFEQGPTAPSHQPGTGIGLALVREFVELHGGSVSVVDTPDGGATFVIELPTTPSRELADLPEERA